MSTMPSDSILRRHYEQLRQAAGAGAPQDSILRRHHEQMRQAAQPHAAPTVEKPTPPAPQEQAAPAASRPATPAPAASSEGGGFFAWLKKIFGG